MVSHSCFVEIVFLVKSARYLMTVVLDVTPSNEAKLMAMIL